MARKLERVEELEIIQMYESGVPVLDIEVEMDVSKNSIYRILKQEGVELRAQRNIGRPSYLDSMSEADQEAFLLDYRSDMTVADICEKWGMRSNLSLYALLRILQEPLRRTSPSNIQARKAQKDHAVEMYRQGYYIWQIVQETGIVQPDLHLELHRRNVPLRRPMKAKDPSK